MPLKNLRKKPSFIKWESFCQISAREHKGVKIVSWISKEVIKEVVLMEAVPKIVERGTKIPPTFIKPISGGRLTSRFGRRSNASCSVDSV